MPTLLVPPAGQEVRQRSTSSTASPPPLSPVASHRLPRRQRRGQDDEHADPARPRGPDERDRHPARRRRPLRRPSPSHPRRRGGPRPGLPPPTGRAPRHHAPHGDAGRGAQSASRPDPRALRHGGRGRPPGRRLLARHAPAARPGVGPGRGPVRSSSSTSRSTSRSRTASAGCAASSAPSRMPGARSSFRATCSARSRPSPTTSSSSTTAPSRPPGPVDELVPGDSRDLESVFHHLIHPTDDRKAWS